MDDSGVWLGWEFTLVGEKPEGGHAYKYYLYRRKRYLAQCGVIKILQNLAPSLVTGTPDPAIDDAKIKTILQAIEQQLPGYGLKHCRNFFVQGLNLGVRAGLWKIHVPAPIITVPRKKALFQPTTFAALPRLRKFQSALEQTWSDEEFFGEAELYLARLKNLKGFRPGEEKKQLRAGQLLLTTLLYSGLLDTKYLYLLPRHIDKLQANTDVCWIDFNEELTTQWETDVPRQASSDKGKRLYKETLFQKRWFPDSVTELLLLRWYADQLGEFPIPKNLTPDKSESYCQYLISAFLAAVGFSEKPMLLRGLLKCAITQNALVLPTFLLHVAAGKIATTSLPPRVWQRLYSDCRGEIVTLDVHVAPSETVLPLDEPLICDDFVIHQYDQYQLYKILVKRLTRKRVDPTRPHAKSIAIIELFSREHQGQLAPALLRLCQWAIELYRNGSSNQTRLAASTVANYIGQLQDLVNVIGAEDPLALEGDELLEIYQDLIDRSKTPKSKAFKAGRVKEFHNYLRRCGYDEPLNLSELEGVSSQGASVDANYINETAYQMALEAFNQIDASNPRLVTSRRLITMLGYRCGLRRTEAWKLRMCDIQISQYPVLLVRASRHKTVKSSHATRQILLKSLLPQAELNELLKWLEYRRLEQALDGFETDNSFVFCHEHNGLSLIQEAVIFQIIQTVLRAVTGDETVRYHHLRHSCGNNLMLRLQGIDWPELALYQPAILEAEAEAVFGLNSRTPSRKHLFQISVLLGHASPDITLKNYLHLCDYLLRHHLNQAHESLLSIEAITVISGIGRDALYKNRQRKYADLSVLKIAKNQLRSRILPTQTSATSVRQNVPIQWPESLQQYSTQQRLNEPSVAVLHQLIENNDAEHKNAHYWSEKTSYSEYVIQAWFDAADQLSQMKTGKKVSRHIRPQWWGLADTDQKNGIQTQEHQHPPRCMPKPHTQQDIKDAQQTLQQLQQLRFTAPEQIQWGVHYYITTNIVSHSHLRMKTVDDAKRYKEFILALGFSSKRIHCQLKPQRRPGSQSPEQQAKYWAKLLSIIPQQISLKSSIEKRGSDVGTLSMAFINEDGNASYGFRYALYMTAILMLALR